MISSNRKVRVAFLSIINNLINPMNKANPKQIPTTSWNHDLDPS